MWTVRCAAKWCMQSVLEPGQDESAALSKWACQVHLFRIAFSGDRPAAAVGGERRRIPLIVARQFEVNSGRPVKTIW